jgi:glucoamylase
LDEVAFPVMLAWRLWKANGLDAMFVFHFVERAAVIAGLICAAEIVRAHDSTELAVFLEEYADWIEGHLEDWTVTNNGVLDPEIKRHYMRIRPPECGEAYAHESCGKELIRLENRPPGTRVEFEAREIVDAGFLELVRYGVRRADDPLIVDSLKVVDAVLKRELPQGPGWLRYNGDGYGQRPDGGPYQGWGQGRVWPLLTGERAHYELAAGKEIGDLIRTYEGFATAGQLLPEQVWDEADRPGCRLWKGQPAGSAVPLVWAHAEYLKLLRSAVDGKVFDRIDPVYERYSEKKGLRRGKLEISSKRRPIRRIEAGKTLRILDERQFDVVWSADGWQTTHITPSRSLGSAGYSADIAAGAEGGALEWTLHWPDDDSWLGYNVEVKVDAT